MTIKELFKKMEKANEFNELFENNEYALYVWDGYATQQICKNYDQYTNFIKDSYIPQIANILLDAELTKDEHEYKFSYSVQDYLGYNLEGTLEFVLREFER